jgi:hypothetical protein
MIGEIWLGRKRSKRDYWNYTLRDGRYVVKHGITNDPDRRLHELEIEGEKFTSMIFDRFPVSENTARQREQARIDAYRRSHKGKTPSTTSKNSCARSIFIITRY